MLLLTSPLFNTPYCLAASDPCAAYGRQIKKALADCDIGKLADIEHELSKAPCPEIMEELLAAKSQYFLACAVPALNTAYRTCDFDKIAEVEETVRRYLYNCIDYKNISERVLGMKCLYFETCLTRELQKAQEGCDLPQIGRIEQFMESPAMSDCPDHGRMMDKVWEYKCNTFTLCTLNELPAAKRNCETPKILAAEDTLKNHMKDCANYSLMERKIERHKCGLPVDCAQQITKDIEPESCRPNKLWEIEETLPIERWDNCAPYYYQAALKLIDKLECGHLDSCGQADFEYLEKECDLAEILHLEKKLLECAVQRRTAEKIAAHKPRIIERCLQEQLKAGVRNCDLEAIRGWKGFVAQNTLRDESQQERLRAVTEKAEQDYFNYCLEPLLKKGSADCNMGQIKLGAEKIAAEMAAHPKLSDMMKRVEENRCLYFLNCTQDTLERAVEDCDYDRLLALKRASDMTEAKACPGYEEVESGISESMRLYFYDCAQKRLYRAYQDCDWEGILDVEAMVEKDLKFNPEYVKVRVKVLEVKCSYFSTCLSDKLDAAVTARDKRAIEKLRALIDDQMHSCPNYFALSRQLEDALKEIAARRP